MKHRHGQGCPNIPGPIAHRNGAAEETLLNLAVVYREALPGGLRKFAAKLFVRRDCSGR
jgi:hypothetical protein